MRCPTLELLCNSLYGPLPKHLEFPGLYELDINSHRRVDEGVTVENWRMNCLLFADELVLHALIFSTGSSIGGSREGAEAPPKYFQIRFLIGGSRHRNAHWGAFCIAFK